jgi:hypothetical protein
MPTSSRSRRRIAQTSRLVGAHASGARGGRSVRAARRRRRSSCPVDHRGFGHRPPGVETRGQRGLRSGRCRGTGVCRPSARCTTGRAPAICTSQGHTASGFVSMVTAWIVRACRATTASSPGRTACRSCRVAPLVRPSHCSSAYAAPAMASMVALGASSAPRFQKCDRRAAQWSLRVRQPRFRRPRRSGQCGADACAAEIADTRCRELHSTGRFLGERHERHRARDRARTGVPSAHPAPPIAPPWKDAIGGRCAVGANVPPWRAIRGPSAVPARSPAADHRQESSRHRARRSEKGDTTSAGVASPARRASRRRCRSHLHASDDSRRSHSS